MPKTPNAYTYRLKNLGLPPLAKLEDLADATRLSPEFVRYLAFRTDRLYKVFQVPKRSGGERTIAQPSRALKGIQGWILRNILDRLSSSVHCKGFERRTSILDNALPHVGSAVVLTIDLEDFFPSITGDKVFGIFYSIGYSRAVSHILSNLCLFDNRLPQGAPTSPKLANLICSRLDARISGYAGPKGIVYTRYADDVTLSGQSFDGLSKAIHFIPFILRDEGFCINKKKTVFSGTRHRKKVTGLVLSSNSVGIGREKYRELRASFHAVFVGQTSIDRLSHLKGWLSFVKSVDGKSSKRLEAYLSGLIAKYPNSLAANEFSVLFK